MKILVTGASGLLGSKIVERANEDGHYTFSGFYKNIPKLGQPVEYDLKNEMMVIEAIASIKPDVIFHCAALTNVDECESNNDLARKINVEGTKFIAKAANQIEAYLVYISTDYVFDGSKGMYKETDETKPINFYGHTKLLGEKAVTELSDDYLIARTSVIYGKVPASGKSNFALWLIYNLRNEKPINVLIDQFVSPTLNTNLAEMLLEASRRRLNGIYHMAGASRVSRYEFTMKLAEIFDLNKDLIKKIRMNELNWVAERPEDSSLNVLKATRSLDTKPLNLNESLNILKEEIACSKV